MVGPPASQFSEKILSSDGIDFVARLEYDFTLPVLINALEKNKPINNIMNDLLLLNQ